MIQLGGAYRYTKIEDEDEEERRHRRAQFLINKIMENADSVTRRSPPLKVRVCRLRVKIGRKMRKIRNKVRFAVSFFKFGIAGQLLLQLKMLKKGLNGRDTTMTSLPPSAAFLSAAST